VISRYVWVDSNFDEKIKSNSTKNGNKKKTGDFAISPNVSASGES
jgi:hypothetical protein